MRQTVVGLVMMAAAMSFVAAAASQETAGSAQAAAAKFTFRPGQAVCVAVHRSSGGSDMEVEDHVRKAFEKQKVFTLARKVSESDFVFVVWTEYKVVSGSPTWVDRLAREPRKST